MTPVPHKLRRATCALIGCNLGNDPECQRCGAYLYGGDFIECGKLDPLFRLYWRVRHLIRKIGPRRCEQCGKKFRRGYSEYICSPECFDNWLPF